MPAPSISKLGDALTNIGNFEGMSGIVGKFGAIVLNVLIILVAMGIFGFLLWTLYKVSKYNIRVILQGKRGGGRIWATDRGGFFITKKTSKFKLLKHRNARVVPPRNTHLENFVKGGSLLFLMKYGEQDFTPMIVYQRISENRTEIEVPNYEKKMMDNPGYNPGPNPKWWEIWKKKHEQKVTEFYMPVKVNINEKKVDLIPVEGLSKEMAVQDLREVLTKFEQKSFWEKYQNLISMVIMGFIFLIGIWMVFNGLGKMNISPAVADQINQLKIATDNLADAVKNMGRLAQG